MANVANLVVQISADTKKLSTDLKTAETSVESFAAKAEKNFKLVGAVIGTAAAVGIGLLVKNLLDTAAALDQLGDSASAIGLTTKELQRLQFQAGLAGTSAEDMTQAFTFMLSAISNATSGSQQQADAFKRLGLEASALKALKPEEQFNKIAEAFKNIKDKADQVDISRTIFGRGGVGQINLLNSSLTKSAELFSKLGLGLSQGQADIINELDVSRKTLEGITDDFGNKIAAGAAFGFNAVIKGINETIEHYGGLGEASDIISNLIISGIVGIVSAADNMVKVFKALGVVADGVKVVATTLGVGAAKIVSGNFGDIRKDNIAKEVIDPTVKQFADGIENYSKIKNAAEVALDKIKENLASSGDAAEQAAKQIDKYNNSLGTTVAKKSQLEASLKTAGASNFSDEENEFLTKLKGFSDAIKPKSDTELQSSIISKLNALNTTESNSAILDIYKSIGNKNNADRGLGKGGGGYGEIWDENGNFMSVGNQQQHVVVTVVLVPDEGRMFNAIVDSQIFQQKVIETSSKNLIDVTRSDRQ